MKHWHEYIKRSYELIIEAEGKTSIILTEDIEYYIVRLVAKWFDHNDVPPDTPIAILLMNAMQEKNSLKMAETAEACLFYDSFKIKQNRWPSTTYYRDMGSMAYGMAYVVSNDVLYNKLEENFSICSKIISTTKLIH